MNKDDHTVSNYVFEHSSKEIEINTLAQRLRDTLVSQRSVGMAPDLVAAWTCI